MFCRNCGKELIGTPEICVNCGAKPLAGTSFCHACGAATTPLAEICMKCGARLVKEKQQLTKPAVEVTEVSPKSRLATTLLAFFLGGAGAHRFYLGKIRTAVVMLVLVIVGALTTEINGIGYIFLIPVWIWALVDFIYAVAGKMKDKEGKLITKW